MQLIHQKELDFYWQKAEKTEKIPLKITFTTHSPVVNTDAIALDSLLAYAVVLNTIRQLSSLAEDKAYWLPVPLELAFWFDNLPVWQSSFFAPVNSSSLAVYFHQRTDANPIDIATTSAKRRMPSNKIGQYANYRLPLKTIEADRWEASCLGNKAEIERLLGLINFVGKKRSQGYGRVASWKVEEIEDFNLWQDEEPIRPLPIEGTPSIFCGWTSPYWDSRLWRNCRCGKNHL